MYDRQAPAQALASRVYCALPRPQPILVLRVIRMSRGSDVQQGCTLLPASFEYVA